MKQVQGMVPAPLEVPRAANLAATSSSLLTGSIFAPSPSEPAIGPSESTSVKCSVGGHFPSMQTSKGAPGVCAETPSTVVRKQIMNCPLQNAAPLASTPASIGRPSEPKPEPKPQEQPLEQKEGAKAESTGSSEFVPNFDPDFLAKINANIRMNNMRQEKPESEGEEQQEEEVGQPT